MSVAEGATKRLVFANVVWMTLLITAYHIATAEQMPQNHVSVDSLRHWGSSLFAIERFPYEGRTIYSTQIVADSENVLSQIAQEHEMFLSYLVDHGHQAINFDKPPFSEITDSVEFNRAFARSLERDTSFCQWLLPALSQWFTSKGSVVDGNFSTTSDTSSWNWEEVIQLATQFVYVDGLTPDHQLQTHFCVGQNGIESYTGRKNLWIEAFVFDAIMNDLYTEDSKIVAEYQRLGKQVKFASASNDSATTVLRAQGAMFVLMSQSEVFTKVLKDAYTNAKDFLPVRIYE